MNAPAMKVSLVLTVKLVSVLVKHLNLKFYPDMTSCRFNSKQLKFNSNILLYLLKCVHTLLTLILVAEHACSTKPCKNGASCIDTMGGFICTCAPGWTGAFCEGCKYRTAKTSKTSHLNSRICTTTKWNIYALCQTLTIFLICR